MMDAGVRLGAFLRSRRERLSASDLRITDTRRRRTPGLRREEVASLAGMSSEWYVKLEQGRGATPSAATLDALARALRLSEAERAHLIALASGGGGAWSPEEVPETLQRLVAALPFPAYVTGLRQDMLAWNAAAALLIGDPGGPPDKGINILEFVLTTPRGRELFGEHWADESRRMVALFRRAHDLHAEEPAFADLVARLSRGCPQFAGWWSLHDVAEPRSGRKRLTHPALGPVTYDFSTFQANDDPRLKLVVYTPIDAT